MVSAMMLLIAAAEAAQLRLVVPTETMSVGQTVFAELQLISGAAEDLPEIETPPGLRAQFTGTSQSMTSINFKTTRVMTYNLGVTALQEGVWTLGPATAVVGGERLTAPAVTFTVTPRTAEAASRASVTAVLSDESPYVGEVEVYHFQYRRSMSTYSDELSPLSFDGFVQVSDAEEGRASYAVAEAGGQVSVDDIYLPLEALSPGRHTLAPAVLTARVPSGKSPGRRSPFGRSQQTKLETFSTEAIDVEIRPLPSEGRPSSYSGLVGQFALSARPSARSLPLGESITLEVRLVGDGRLAGAKLPTLVSEDVQVYDDSPEYSAAVIDGRYQSSAMFRRAIVPAREGRVTIPPIEIVSFDPDLEQYVTLRTESLALQVTPGEAGVGEVTSFSGGDGRREVEELGDDILPAPGAARVRDRRLAAVLPWLLAAPAVPTMALLGLALWARRPRADRRAELRRALGSLPVDSAERLKALESLFREVVGLRLGIAGPAVTGAQIEALGEAAVAIDEALSRARYGGAAAVAGLEEQVRAFIGEEL
jgi:hypothetical protein